MAISIGIDVGGTNLRIGVFDRFELLQETRVQADFSSICKQNPPDEAWHQILQITSSGIQQSLNQFPEVEHIGIGFPGFIDPITNNIAQSPNLPGIRNVNLANGLAAILQKKVVVENDALAAAYGEFCRLEQPGSSLIYIGLGTGVGGGLVHSNQLFTGQHGVAMELGHIIVKPEGRLCGCGNLGCVEQYASASGVSLSYFEATGQQLSAHAIANLANNADALAINAYETAAEYLAQMLASVLKVVDISEVVIGGGMANAWHLMRATFETRLDADLIPVLRGKINVHISNSGDIAGMLGAALLASRLIEQSDGTVAI